MINKVSVDWILNLLAGMSFPNQGEAHDFVKHSIQKFQEPSQLWEHTFDRGYCDQELIKILTNHEQKGWELISVTENPTSRSFVLFFKRRVQSGE